jgi:peptidoglycan/xylan/chitin deacetylase (PgdA/CDA1 family)
MLNCPRRETLVLFAFSAVLSLAVLGARAVAPAPTTPVATILVYHRFGPKVADNMTITTALFAAHLRYLHDNGYNVVPLRDVVDFLSARKPLPPRAVAITVDDGHRTVFTEMKPLVERYHVPVTLFIYPSAISNASYAMSWDQLRALQETGLFDIQGHTYWHPNFKQEKRRLPQNQFEEFVRSQLTKPREVLKAHLSVTVDMLAWPFGIYDDELIRVAREIGYVAGVTLDRHPVSASTNAMAMPRYLVTQEMAGKAFANVLQAGGARSIPNP